ncbi:MAG: hypothetical protein JWQ64_1998 [Subtercola sp.]|jgi:hypothetical protein|nr:hypothetical protein [Subtercola sp.]
MAATTYALDYDGRTFMLSEADYARLHKIYDTGLAVSSILFRFVPVGSEVDVEIAVGSGAQFVVTKQTH